MTAIADPASSPAKARRTGVIGQWALVLASNVVTQGVAFLTLLLLARVLVPEEFGRFALLVTIISVFGAIGMLGTRQLVVREIAKHQPVARARGTFTAVKLGAGVVSAVLATAYAAGVEGEHRLPVLAAVALSVAFWVAADHYEALLVGSGAVPRFALANIAGAIVPMGLLLAAMHTLTLPGAVAITATGYALRALLLGGGAPAPVAGDPARDTRWLVRESWPFYLLALITMASFQLPTMFLGRFASLVDVAHFNAANKTCLGLLLVISSLTTVLLPQLARAWEFDRPAFGGIAQRFMTVTGVAFVGGTMLLAIAAEPLVVLLFGAAYRPVASVLVLQAWYVDAMLVFNIIGTALAAAGRQRLLSRLGVAYTSILLACTLVGSFWGARGVAIGYVASAVINMTYHWRIYVRELAPAASAALLAWMAAACVVAVLVMPALPVTAAAGAAAVTVAAAWLVPSMRVEVAAAAHALVTSFRRRRAASHG